MKVKNGVCVGGDVVNEVCGMRFFSFFFKKGIEMRKITEVREVMQIRTRKKMKERKKERLKHWRYIIKKKGQNKDTVLSWKKERKKETNKQTNKQRNRGVVKFEKRKKP